MKGAQQCVSTSPAPSSACWQAADAAQAAPVILLALAAGLTLSLWGLHEDNKRYSNSGLGKIEGYSAKHKDDEEMGA